MLIVAKCKIVKEKRAKVVAPQRIRDELKEWVDRENLYIVAGELRMSRETVSRLIGGLPVHEGTLLLAEKELEATRFDPTKVVRRSADDGAARRPVVKDGDAVRPGDGKGGVQRPTSGPVTATIGEIVGKGRAK